MNPWVIVNILMALFWILWIHKFGGEPIAIIGFVLSIIGIFGTWKKENNCGS